MAEKKILDGNSIRKEYPLLSSQAARKLVYLDSAATSQKPKVVIDAITRFYSKENANVHRGIYALSAKATLDYEAARMKVARFSGAKTSEVVFTSGTTMSLNLVARSLLKNLKAGDEILLSLMEHHSNFVCWQQLAKERG